MTAYLTADLHFNHHRILDLVPDRREQFKDLDAMTEEYTRQWKALQPGDQLWHLGDFALGNWQHFLCHVERLHDPQVDVFMLPGNHDKVAMRRMTRRELWPSNWTVIEAGMYTIDGEVFFLDHYPHDEWRRMNTGRDHLHGHSHGNAAPQYGRWDVGIDIRRRILSIDEVRAELRGMDLEE